MYRDCIAFAVYSNSQAIMDIMLPSPELEEPPSGQSHNLLNIALKEVPLAPGPEAVSIVAHQLD